MFIDTNLSDRARNSIAQFSLTNSKRPECFVNGVYPHHLSRGQGAYVWDTKNNRYIDFVCSLGSNLLGYANHELGAAIAESYRRGSCLSLGTDTEVEFAEEIKSILPFVDLIKVFKNGGDACNASIKIARAYTGRELVLSEGYHGPGDDFISLTPPALGVPKRHWIGALKDCPIDSRVAAVIVEPVMTDITEDRKIWLQKLRDECTKAGALLIFDEVITGLRVPQWTIANHWGIKPDLICMGKAMGGGLPISIVGGKTDIMNCGEYFTSSTFAGERCSMAAALKTIRLLKNKFKIDHLWSSGERFLSRFNALSDKLKIEGYPTRGVFKGDELTKALFFQEACKAGLLFGSSWFFNFHHIELADDVISACRDILTRIKTGAVSLEGERPSSPFAQKQRE